MFFVYLVNIITDRDTGKRRGFAFVTFEQNEDANDAIEGLNNTVSSNLSFGYLLCHSGIHTK